MTGPAGPFADFTTETLCARILERHRSTIRVQKDHVAVKKLALIVDAVLDLSNKQGFHATSLRDLAQASGVSMGSLYSYFDSKNTLLMMILAEVSFTVGEVLANPPAEAAADPVKHLDWLIDTHIRLTEAMQRWFVFAFMEAKFFPVQARRFAVDSEAATEAVFATVLRRGVAEKRFAITDPDLTAALIKPLLQDWYVKRGKYRKRGTTIEAYIAAVSNLVDTAILKRSDQAIE
ncbi:TetR family transcriptional regulator [Metarhizobium album]|uniref:TetR family transcriptional regulator n=1 Tax=Metarhizobium album TaxID=2182425 RepID=A0A2U2DLY8_9HYPH|nr:TetR/AcrR family transcriptional regulator [Rhizobium album]PWE54316.1 TetR family transcriptional regulator [Rhizobium album]